MNFAGVLADFEQRLNMHVLQCRYAHMVTCTDFVKEGNKVVEVRAEGRKLSSDEKPPKVRHIMLQVTCNTALCVVTLHAIISKQLVKALHNVLLPACPASVSYKP